MEQFKNIISGDVPVLVDFFATWCGPCKAMSSVLEQLKGLMGDKYRILKLDIDSRANKRLMVEYKVSSVPTLMIFRRGEIVWRHSGAMSVGQLQEVLEGIS